MDKQILFLLILILFISIISFYGNSFNSLKIESASAASPNYTLRVCNYNDITPLFQQNGLPAQFSIIDVQELNSKPQYFNILLLNTLNNLTESYLYGLGSDGKLNTTDDFSHYLGNMSNFSMHVSPVVVLVNGSTTDYTLYWINHLFTGKEVKACTIKKTGCLNTSTLASLPAEPLAAIIPSDSQDKIYFAYKEILPGGYPSQYYSVFKSCSIQSGTQDKCRGNFSNYTSYNSIYPYNVTYTHHKTLKAVGFLVYANYPQNYPLPIAYPDSTYIFDINSPTPRVMALEGGFDINSFISLGIPGTLIGVKNDPNFTHDTLSVLDTTLNFTYNLDVLEKSIHDSHFIDFSSNIVVVYGDSTVLYGKALGYLEEEIYANATVQPGTVSEIVIKAVLADNSVIGLTPYPDNKIVKFTCKP